jgi:hypothetical protein
MSAVKALGDLSPREAHDLWDLQDDGYADMLARNGARSERLRAEQMAESNARHAIETDPRTLFNADGAYALQRVVDDGDPVV